MNLAEHLRANPELVSLDRATLYLASRARARTPLGAAEYLDFIEDPKTYEKRCEVALECMEIYKRFFPEVWADSAAPYLSVQREQELYCLIDEYLFPFRVSETVAVTEFIRSNAQFYTRMIPMRGLQAHMWVEGQFDFWEVQPAFHLALVMSRMISFTWETIVELYDLPADAAAPAPPLAAVGWSLFTYSCAVEETPLRHFPLAFHFVTYKTGNAWLDIPQVGVLGFEWSVRKVGELAMQRAQAEQMGEAITELSNWIEEDPAARIGRAVELWNDAAEKERQAGGEDLIHDERGELYRRENWF